MAEPSTPMIVTDGLSKTYSEGRSFRALDRVSLSVGRREFAAVMGASGSGKSTLLNLIGALDVPTEGRVVIDGLDVASLAEDALADFRREKIGFVFQLFNLLPELTALENVMMPLLPYRAGLSYDLERRAIELLALVGLPRQFDHLPGQLSGGEQQRVAVARALVNAPAVVVADEPTGNLDTSASEEVMGLMRRACDEWRSTVLLVTHNPRVAALADRVFFLKDGALVDEVRLGGEQTLDGTLARLGLAYRLEHR